MRKMMNQLPIDVQLIVYKHLHTSASTDTLRDMMNRLRSNDPCLRAMGHRSEGYDEKLQCRILKINRMYVLYSHYNNDDNVIFIRVWKKTDQNNLFGDWYYPSWYFLTSDAFLGARKGLKSS